MIEIPDPPTTRVCASCSSPVTWLYSPRKTAWVGFVPAGPEHAIRPHPCRQPGRSPTWRETPHRSEPTPEYVAARAALRERTEHRHITEEEPE